MVVIQNLECIFDRHLSCDTKCGLLKCSRVQLRQGLILPTEVHDHNKINRNIVTQLNERVINVVIPREKIRLEKLKLKRNKAGKTRSDAMFDLTKNSISMRGIPTDEGIGENV